MGALRTFPVSLVVAGRRVVVAGDGEAAAGKLRLLGKSQAEVHLFTTGVIGVAAAEAARLGYPIHQRRLLSDDLKGAALVVVATEAEADDRELAAMARSAGVIANVVDRPELCDVLTPAFVDRAPVTIAISTEGAAPVLAGLLRSRIEALLPSSLGTLAQIAGSLRGRVADLLPAGRRLDFWRAYFTSEETASAARYGGAVARRSAMKLLDEVRSGPGAPGMIWFIGAGAGAADLLTLRAQRVLSKADVVIHEAGIDYGILDLARRDARRIVVTGREPERDIVARLVAEARQRLQVVRLSPGTSAVSARDAALLTEAGLRWAEVPGVAEPQTLGDRPVSNDREVVAA